MAQFPPEIWMEADYRSVLRRILEHRSKKKPPYSLRAFARDLGLSPSAISEIFSRKRGLSRERAEAIAVELEFTPEETSFFCDLVEKDSARSEIKRKIARARIKSEMRGARFRPPAEKSSQIFDEWHHLAILELTSCNSFVHDTNWIAHKLGITPEQVIDSIERLKQAGFLEDKEGRLRGASNFNFTLDAGPATHQKILEKAISSLRNHPQGSREIVSNVLAVHADQITAAKEALQAFSDHFVARFGAAYPKGKTDVYSFSLQFFRLTERDSGHDG